MLAHGVTTRAAEFGATVEVLSARDADGQDALLTQMISQRVDAMVVTRGEHGAQIYHSDGVAEIPAVKARQVVDPTGCGDAFRGGLLYGIENGLGWEKTGRLASLMGSLKIEHQGPQTYAPTRTEIEDRFKQAFGTSLS